MSDVTLSERMKGVRSRTRAMISPRRPDRRLPTRERTQDNSWASKLTISVTRERISALTTEETRPRTTLRSSRTIWEGYVSDEPRG